MRKSLEALTGPHEQDHHNNQHLARPQLLAPPHLLHGHLICGEGDTGSETLSADLYRCPDSSQRFENMLMATWGGSNRA